MAKEISSLSGKMFFVSTRSLVDAYSFLKKELTLNNIDEEIYQKLKKELKLNKDKGFYFTKYSCKGFQTFFILENHKFNNTTISKNVVGVLPIVTYFVELEGFSNINLQAHWLVYEFHKTFKEMMLAVTPIKKSNETFTFNNKGLRTIKSVYDDPIKIAFGSPEKMIEIYNKNKKVVDNIKRNFVSKQNIKGLHLHQISTQVDHILVLMTKTTGITTLEIIDLLTTLFHECIHTATRQLTYFEREPKITEINIVFQRLILNILLDFTNMFVLEDNKLEEPKPVTPEPETA